MERDDILSPPARPGQALGTSLSQRPQGSTGLLPGGLVWLPMCLVVPRAPAPPTHQHPEPSTAGAWFTSQADWGAGGLFGWEGDRSKSQGLLWGWGCRSVQEHWVLHSEVGLNSLPAVQPLCVDAAPSLGSRVLWFGFGCCPGGCCPSPKLGSWPPEPTTRPRAPEVESRLPARLATFPTAPCPWERGCTQPQLCTPGPMGTRARRFSQDSVLGVGAGEEPPVTYETPQRKDLLHKYCTTPHCQSLSADGWEALPSAPG